MEKFQPRTPYYWVINSPLSVFNKATRVLTSPVMMKITIFLTMIHFIITYLEVAVDDPVHLVILISIALLDWSLSVAKHIKKSTYQTYMAKKIVGTIFFYVALLSALKWVGVLVNDLTPIADAGYNLAKGGVIMTIAVSDLTSCLRHAADLGLVKGKVADYISTHIDQFKSAPAKNDD